jgi:hypothetical protein
VSESVRMAGSLNLPGVIQRGGGQIRFSSLQGTLTQSGYGPTVTKKLSPPTRGIDT